MSGTSAVIESPIEFQVRGSALAGMLTEVERPLGVAIISRGSGDSVQVETDATIGRRLGRAGFTVLVCDLLTAQELLVDHGNSDYRSDVDFMARRLGGVVGWARQRIADTHAPIAIVASGVTASAAILVAVDQPHVVGDFVCRSARYDLVRFALGRVRARSLLQIGEHDTGFGAAVEALGALPDGSAIDVIEGVSGQLDGPELARRITRSTVGWLERATATSALSGIRHRSAMPDLTLWQSQQLAI